MSILYCKKVGICQLNALDVSADILLSDILKKGYAVKESVLAEKLENLPVKEKQKIYDVIETLLEHR